MTTGERIKTLRIQKGLSQEELGKLVGLQKAAINKYETGVVVNLKRSVIAKLSQALDTSPVYLMGWDNAVASIGTSADARKECVMMSDAEVRRIFQMQFNAMLTTKHITQKDVAKALGVSTSTVSTWSKGQNMPRMDTIEKLANLYALPKSYFVEDPAKLPAEAVPYNPTHRIPLLGQIAAGLPLLAEQNIEGYIWTDLNHGGDYFALRVKGDSMNAARINDGDILIIRQQSEVENGEVAVVLVGDENATVKRFYRAASTVTLMPQSSNPAHNPQIYDLSQTPVKVLGKVVKVEFTL